MAIQKNCMGTESSRRPKRHRGLDAIFARFVTRRGNNAALVRPPAHDHGLAAQFWTFEQFHRNEKCIHVHMEYGRLRESRLFLEWTMLGSKPREVRHAP
jgi:hypothetical protein